MRFNLAMARETEDRMLDPERLREGVGRALGDPRRGSYRVAELGGEPVGALLVTREWSDWRDAWFWWIQSVYVRPEYRGRGVFRALYDHIATEARSHKDVIGIRLYVDRGNTGAKRAYERLGMHPTDYDLYEIDWRDS